ncbi:MAG: nucleoside 2-deoxyribosyltransferase [Methanoregulaceae archaeon]|jgi:nucleoside 2-deoxyribosyltransferase|nr:nucleoside 2-deoxyribosyltransferase [Methanoregulaceae archaeon]
MYVLMCPCITNPALRAEGITSEADLDLFRRARARCEHFGIDIVTLPCPETLHLGRDRSPGTFLERLNTPGFFEFISKLESEVREIIRERGPPLCIVGVNSSPTCGTTTTHYGSVNGSPTKRPGRGVFLDRFPDIKAIDVSEFAKYTVYLAAPLFSEAEKKFNQMISELLGSHFFKVYLPQDVGDDNHCRDGEEHTHIFESHLDALDTTDLLVAVIDGADADSGTSWEMGYAYRRGIPVYAVRTDFRMAGHHELVNLMLEQSSIVVRDPSDLPGVMNSPRS